MKSLYEYLSDKARVLLRAADRAVIDQQVQMSAVWFKAYKDIKKIRDNLTIYQAEVIGTDNQLGRYLAYMLNRQPVRFRGLT